MCGGKSKDNPMKISKNGLALIKRFEGCKLNSYRDAVGVWTIGYGHTAMAGGLVPKSGISITQEQADALLKADLVKYEIAVEKLLQRQATQSQFDAMVSLTFNIGAGNFAKSTVLRLFNGGDISGAANAFKYWNRAGGKVLAGLTTRRAAEAALFRS